MEVDLKIFGALCSTEVFNINGIYAKSDDFGNQRDIDTENAEDYGCGNMTFISKPATQDILDKYNITVDEYSEICEKLEDGLSFGNCGWCI